MLLFAGLVAIVIFAIVAQAARASRPLAERDNGSVSESWLTDHRGHRRE
jgi:hypothetical protein